MEPSTPRGPMCYGAPCPLRQWKPYMLQDYGTLTKAQTQRVGKIRKEAGFPSLSGLAHNHIVSSREADPGYQDRTSNESTRGDEQEYTHFEEEDSTTTSTLLPTLDLQISEAGIHWAGTEEILADSDGNATSAGRDAFLGFPKECIALYKQGIIGENITIGLVEPTGKQTTEIPNITRQKRKASRTRNDPFKKHDTRSTRQIIEEIFSAITPEELADASTPDVTDPPIKTEEQSFTSTSQSSSPFTPSEIDRGTAPKILVADAIQIYMDGSGGKFRIKGDWAIYFQGALTGQRFRLEGDSKHGYIFHTGQRWIEVPDA